MKLKLTVVLTLWISIASIFVKAQAVNAVGQVKGTLADAAGKPFDLATVALFKASDTVLVKSDFTGADGKFSFQQLSTGKYIVKISAMGYSTYSSGTLTIDSTHLKIEIPLITLSSQSQNLKEVAIVSQKAFVERKIDRTVVNVDALISNAGTTALDVIEKSPGVMVDQNGIISLKGKKGVVIFIDDKPTYLSGVDLESYLRSLPSSSLSQIEIMSNPPAKYDAAGNAGVINIKTKKGNVKGFNGGINLALTQGKMTRSNNSFSFNYRNKKFNFFGNGGYNLNNSFSDLDINRIYQNEDGTAKSFFEQNSYFKRHGNTYSTKVGADYYASDKTTWGILLTGMSRKSSQLNNNTSNLLNNTRQLDSVLIAQNKDDINYKNGGVNLNYRHQFDKSGHELTFDADYLAYRNKTIQVYHNSSYLPDKTLKSQDVLDGYLPSNIDIYSVKADYALPLKKDWKLSAGLKSSYTKTDNTADYIYTANNISRPDYDRSNHFLYKENINAGYLNINKEGKKFSLQAGLRIENTGSDGHQLGNLMKADSTFTRNYTSIFPTVYLSYKLDTLSNNQIGLNYGRRIDRPYYQDLNPFINSLDKFTYYVGNPFLKPSYTQSIEISHTYKNKITTTLSYSNTKDEVNETIEILNGIYYSRPGNLGRKIVKSISVDAGFDPAAWLNLHLYTEFTHIATKSDFYTGKLNTSGNLWFVSPIAQIKFNKSWNAELSGNYITKVYDAQFISGSNWQANAAVQKKLSASSTLKLSVNDIFYTKINTGTINNLANTQASWVNKGDSRNAVLSFSYRFGKAIADLRKHEATGAQSEQKRANN